MFVSLRFGHLEDRRIQHNLVDGISGGQRRSASPSSPHAAEWHEHEHRSRERPEEGRAVFDLPLSDAARHAEQQQAQLLVQTVKEQLSAARTRVGADAATAIAGERAAREQLANARRTTEIAEET